MSRLIAAFVAVVAVAGVSATDTASAASAEGAIKDWIASIPSGDWKVTYGNIAYDAASDRTLVSGLSATSTSLPVTVAFTTVSITGYTPAADGGFNAAAFNADGGTITTNEAKVTISGLAATNFGTAALSPVAFDQSHPLTSVVAMYRNLLKMHVEHAGVASVSFEDSSDKSDFSYADLAIDNWANGKIVRTSMGAMKGTFVDKDGEQVRFEVANAETRDTDLDAFMRVFDPDRYVGGVGDGVWHPVVALGRYSDVTLQSKDVDITVGDWTLDNLKMRQPQRSFTAGFDKLALLPKGSETQPADVRPAFDLLSSIGLDKFSINDVTIDSNDGFGTLDSFAIRDLSSDGLGEISIEGLDAFYPDGFASIGRLAAGAIVFPGMDKLFAAFEAAAADRDIDPNNLQATLGYIEAANVDFETAEAPETGLDKLRIDLANYVGLVPTAITVDVAGLSTSVDLFSEDDADKVLKALGYDRIRADYGVKVTWHEADKTVAIDNFRLSLADMGAVTGNAVLAGLTRENIQDVGNLTSALAQLSLVSSSITIEDKSLINRWIAQQAYEAGINQDAFRQMLASGGIRDAVADLGGSQAFKDKVTAALSTYILRPGTLTVTAKPPDPVPVTGVALLSALFPDTLADILGLDVVAVAGPIPMPFNYVPPRPQDTKPPAQSPAAPSSPAPAGDDLRHVPFKKY